MNEFTRCERHLAPTPPLQELFAAFQVALPRRLMQWYPARDLVTSRGIGIALQQQLDYFRLVGLAGAKNVNDTMYFVL